MELDRQTDQPGEEALYNHLVNLCRQLLQVVRDWDPRSKGPKDPLVYNYARDVHLN